MGLNGFKSVVKLLKKTFLTHGSLLANKTTGPPGIY